MDRSGDYACFKTFLEIFRRPEARRSSGRPVVVGPTRWWAGGATVVAGNGLGGQERPRFGLDRFGLAGPVWAGWGPHVRVVYL